MKLISDCLEIERNAEICRKEEGKQICFSHQDYEVVCEVVQIEKCVFKHVQGGKRCDFLFCLTEPNNNIIFWTVL